MNRTPETLDEMLDAIARHLDGGHTDEALRLVRKFGTENQHMRNAYGVCLMRTGNLQSAIEVYRGLVLNHQAVTIKRDIPNEFKLNYAIALLLSANVHGSLAILADMHDEQNPAVVRVREAIRKWKQTLGMMRRIRFALGSTIEDRPITLDFPPGEVRTGPRLRPAA